MTDFTKANIELREIKLYNSTHASTTLNEHWRKMCVIISVTEFEKCLKKAITRFLGDPKSRFVELVKVLEATERKEQEYVYSRFGKSCEKNGIYNIAEKFFKLVGNTIANQIKSKSFDYFVNCQKKLYARDIAKVRIAHDTRNDMTRELSIIEATTYDESQDLFLELIKLRNEVAHQYTLDSSYTIVEVIDKFHRAKLFVGAVEAALVRCTK